MIFSDIKARIDILLILYAVIIDRRLAKLSPVTLTRMLMVFEIRFLSRSSLGAIFRYLGSGGAATTFHWATMACLLFWGMSPTLSTGLGALAGAVLNYFLHFHFTFLSTSKHQQTLPPYVLVTLLSWLSNSALFFFLFKTMNLSVALAQLITTTFITLLNFFLYQKLVFHAATPSSIAK